MLKSYPINFQSKAIKNQKSRPKITFHNTLINIIFSRGRELLHNADILFKMDAIDDRRVKLNPIYRTGKLEPGD